MPRNQPLTRTTNEIKRKTCGLNERVEGGDNLRQSFIFQKSSRKTLWLRRVVRFFASLNLNLIMGPTTHKVKRTRLLTIKIWVRLSPMIFASVKGEFQL